ncbi:DUF2442 domain-containing protein [Cellvibrio sp.]|uniref:DUF2442 domain-containing protein n=1 Tax=Cellvibrio sp. TaxID=1965322 RepID=UPI0039648247
MNISPKSLTFDDNNMWLVLSDGRTLGVPLVWFPRLMNAPKAELEKFELSSRGIHWDSLNEDISVDGLLLGQGDITHKPHRAA